MIIVVGNTKGGVGKTTLALQIALGLGPKTWFVDADEQETGATALAGRVGEPLACSSFPEGKRLRTQVAAQAGFYENVVIDVGGRDTLSLRAALAIADVVLVPFAPQSFDVWAMEDMARIVGEVRAQRETSMRVIGVMNGAEPRAVSKDNNEAWEAVSKIEGYEMYPRAFSKRKAFATASSQGKSVLEITGRGVGKAQDEARDLIKFLKEMK